VANYTFTAGSPGTYLYESNADAGRQVAMGMYGALVVRPATAGRAYDDATTAFDREQVMVLSEIDPALNAAPLTFNMLNWKPTYWLIGGKAYPGTDVLHAAAGEKVLLRWVNAGLENVTMTMLGLRSRLVGADAAPLSDPVNVVADTFPAGSTADAIVTVPPGAPAGTRFPLYNRQLHLTNGAQAGSHFAPGGMLTFLDVTGP
jgi:FtsP/CotA-like multicopper oxidase with cupredoxin domain